MALTDTTIKALKPQATTTEGFLWRVYPTGGMAWRYRYRLKGKPEKVALGKSPALSLKAARLKRNELAATVAQGHSPAKQKQLLCKVAPAAASPTGRPSADEAVSAQKNPRGVQSRSACSAATEARQSSFSGS